MPVPKTFSLTFSFTAAAAAQSLQSCPTLCDPRDGSPPGSPVPGILQARTLEQVAISFSNAWKWKMKVKSLSQVWFLATPWTAVYQAPPSMDSPGKNTGVGCHCFLLHYSQANSFLASTMNFQVFIYYIYRLYLSSHCDIMTYKKYILVLHDDFGVWSLKVIHVNSREIEMKLIITIYIHINVCVEDGHGNKT